MRGAVFLNFLISRMFHPTKMIIATSTGRNHRLLAEYCASKNDLKNTVGC